MCRHAECDDVVFLTISLEIGRVVALMAVENEKPIGAFRPRSRMGIEVLNPAYTKLIIRPSILAHGDDTVFW